MRRRAPTLLLLALAAALAVVATGCGGGSSDADGAEVADIADESGGGEEQETTTNEAAPEDPEEALLAFTKCLREHGIDVPDPEFEGGGRARMSLGDSGIDPDDPEFRKAQEECQPILASIRGQFDEEDRRRFQDAALEFARCMRGKGFDVPDPDFSGEGPGGRGAVRQFFGDVDTDDPKFRAAQEECNEAFEGLGGRIGPGGRDGGGSGDAGDSE